MKRIMMMILCGILATSIAGCGDSDPEAKDADTEIVTEETTKTCTETTMEVSTEEFSEETTTESMEASEEQSMEEVAQFKHDFRNSDWGDTLEQVKAAETELNDGFVSGDTSGSGYFGYTGEIQMDELGEAPINVLYLFSPDGKLINGMYTITYSSANNEILRLASDNMITFSNIIKDITGESGDMVFMDNDGQISLVNTDGMDIELPEDKTLCYYFPENVILIQLNSHIENPTLQVQFNGCWADEWKEDHGVAEWPN